VNPRKHDGSHCYTISAAPTPETAGEARTTSEVLTATGVSSSAPASETRGGSRLVAEYRAANPSDVTEARQLLRIEGPPSTGEQHAAVLVLNGEGK
jgi:hypothetical protein